MLPTDLPQQTAVPNTNLILKHPLSDLFNPRSIAVIGASTNPAKIGSLILSNIVNGGYQGRVYPVNIHSTQIMGMPAFKSVKNIPGSVDHAVIAVPADIVPGIVKECAEKEIKGCSIISAGFREVGPKGEALENKILNTALSSGMSILGPNCLGFINTKINLNATFSAVQPEKGNIMFFSQSGAFGTAVLDWASQVHLGFTYFVSLGNKMQIDETSLLQLWISEYEQDTRNIVFSGYLEDISRGQLFMEACSHLSRLHPIALLKAGKTHRTQQAIVSHTGAMATDDIIIDTALRQSGCTRVEGIQHLFDTIQMLSRQSIPGNNRIAIVTNAGGPGVLTTEHIEDSELTMATLSDTSLFVLKQKLPPAVSVTNPIDILGDATAERYDQTLETVLIDENVDSVVVVLTPQAGTQVEKTASVIVEKYRKYPFKPVVACFIGGSTVKPGIDILNRSQMPVFSYPGQAVNALRSAVQCRRALTHKLYIKPSKAPAKVTADTPRGYVLGESAERFVSQFGIPIPPSVYLQPGQLPGSAIMKSLHFPVVVKLISAELLHKVEARGVILSIRSENELTRAVGMLHNRWKNTFPDKNNYTVQIQPFYQTGELCIIGFKQDPSFGPVIMFGSGGTLTEIHKDSTHRIAPIDKNDVLEMISETKMSILLNGYRGTARRDIDSISNSLVAVSRIAEEHPEIMEFDINPFIVFNEGSGGFAVDIKIITLYTPRNAQTHPQY